MRKLEWIACLALAVSCSAKSDVDGETRRPDGPPPARDVTRQSPGEPTGERDAVSDAFPCALVEIGEPLPADAGPSVDAAGVREVGVDARYVAAGDALRGKIMLSLPAEPAGRTTLRLSANRDVDVTSWPDLDVEPLEPTASRAVEGAGAFEVPFTVSTLGMLSGGIRVKAELHAGEGKEAALLSAAWGPPVRAGVRRRVDLAGDWKPVEVEEWTAFAHRPPQGWTLPEPEAVRLPGSLDAAYTEHFRGWVTLERRVAWKAPPGLAPRFLLATGVQDGVLASLNGAEVGEARSEKDIDCTLTHWLEFHGKGQLGENNTKRNRNLIKDLDVMPLAAWPLEALPAEGEAEVRLRLRGTSGLFRRKPVYGVHGDLCLELAPAVHIRSVTFDTEKPGEERRFLFNVGLVNESGEPFSGQLRVVYGEYDGRLAYTGRCPAYAEERRAVTIAPGVQTFEVVRSERPRFATCRATFVLEDEAGAVLDAREMDFHTVTVEIRDRRDIYLNNERFITKGRGSHDRDFNQRWQLRVNGVNTMRGHYSKPSRRFSGCESSADLIDERLADGLLTSAGSALFASCERCTFWDPDDTSNVTRAVEAAVRDLHRCPGIIQWEAFNELYGETEDVRVKVQEEFHRLDPYHRPVLMTKGGGEWEAEAREGRVAGPDIVGVQYLLTKEGVDSITAAVTEQPLICSEVNWNSGPLVHGDMWEYWLSKGLAGSLLFDYWGNSSDQGAPLVPLPDRQVESHGLMGEGARGMYQDLAATAVRRADGRVDLSVANQMPYAVRGLVLRVRESARIDLPALAPGDAVDCLLPAGVPLADERRVAVLAEYETHGGLPHVAVLTPEVKAMPEGGQRR
jgi:hypothetical protein